MYVRLSITERPTLGSKLWVDEPEQSAVRVAAISDPVEREMAETFVRDGFVIIRNAVSRELCDACIFDYDQWVGSNIGPAEFRRNDRRNKRLQNFHLTSRSIAELFTASAPTLAAQDLLFGYRASVYTSLFFQYGTEQALHRDVPVFRTAPEDFYFGVWYALEDAGAENGNLIVMRGGHRIMVDQYAIAERNVNDVDKISPTDYHLWDLYQAEVKAEGLRMGLTIEEISMQKGDALIWHPLLPHGGGPVRNPARTRHSVVFHTVPEGVPVYKADVFFNRKRAQESDESKSAYRIMSGRLIMERGAPIFGGV